LFGQKWLRKAQRTEKKREKVLAYFENSVKDFSKV